MTGMLCALGSSACGDDEPPPTYVTGFDAERPLNELNESERVALCESQRVFIETHIDLESLLRFACLPLGVIGFVSQEVCQTALDACLLASHIQVGGWVTTSCDASTPLLGCNATVQDLEVCLNLRTHARLQVGAQTCDPSAEPIVRDAQQVESHPACVRVTQSCPHAIEPIEPIDGPQ